MQNMEKSEASYIISDHRITLFYFFAENITPSLCYEELTHSGLPASPAAAIPASIRLEPIWKETSFNLSIDLSPAIHKLFHARSEQQKAVVSWRIADTVIK